MLFLHTSGEKKKKAALNRMYVKSINRFLIKDMKKNSRLCAFLPYLIPCIFKH